MFVTTRASDYVIKFLQKNSCVTLTAPAGVGKSFTARHTALVLQKEQYKIIPVYSPTDIRDYYQPDKQTVFIIDDICGNFIVNHQQIENWKQLLPVINTIIKDKHCKIIVCCRLQIYRDKKFNLLSPFVSCECNLISDKLCLTAYEKKQIANMYIGTKSKSLNEIANRCEFFPLLCCLYHKEKDADVNDFFRNPFGVYKDELDDLSKHGVVGKHKVCSLALCVLFNNQLLEKWFQGKVTNEQRQILEDTCEACSLSRSTSKAELNEALNTLDGTFIRRQHGIYKAIHDKLFDFLVHYFSQKMIECLLDHGNSDLIMKRFMWQNSFDDSKPSIDFIIKIPDDYLDSFLERLTKDWSEGKVIQVLSNTNMEVSGFRQQILHYLRQLDKSKQKTLANTKDSYSSRYDFGPRVTSLLFTCYQGYPDIVQWLLDNDADQCLHTCPYRESWISERNKYVDIFNINYFTPLYLAVVQGHTDIVKMLLVKNANVNLRFNYDVSTFLGADKIESSDRRRSLLREEPGADLRIFNGCPLIVASKQGHSDIVRLLLVKNPIVDISDNQGMTALSFACLNGYTIIVGMLLEKYPNINLCDNNGRSPLYIASSNGHADIVRLLIERNPNVDICNKLNGSSPLLAAVENGNVDTVKLLLERNPDVDFCSYNVNCPLCMVGQTRHTDKKMFLSKEKNYNVTLCTWIYGCSPLYKACLYGHTEIVRMLLEKNPNVDPCNNEGKTPLFIACQKGYTTIVDMLLKRNPNLNLCDNIGQSPLLIASKNKNIDIVRLLLESNPNLDICDNNGGSPLFVASCKENSDIVRLLLERNPNVNLCTIDGCSPLSMACYIGNIDTVRLLLESKPNVDICDKNGYCPLFVASEQGNSDIVSLLLEKNPNINLCTIDGCSPLSMACHIGNIDTVRLLLESKPNVDICDKNGCCPLFVACKQGNSDIVRLLLERNSNVNLCTIAGCSPLSMACQIGNIDTVWLLLERKPNINLCDNDGFCPLSIASNKGNSDIVSLLLKSNADVNLRNNNGETALCIACKKCKLGHSTIVNMLLEKNADCDLSTIHGFTPLIYSCLISNFVIAQQLIKHKANINAQTYDGGNALYFSTLNGNIEITQLLLENKADCNICINSKQSIRDALIDLPIITLDTEKQALNDSLIEDGSLHVKDYVKMKSIDYAFGVVAGSSPLHIACFIGWKDVVSCLLDHHANINMKKENDTTPLFYACELGHEDIVRLLLEKGADTDTCRQDGTTPLNIATENGHQSVIMLIKEHEKD